MQLLCAPATFSQRSFTSFGAVSELQLGFRPAGLAAGPMGDGTPVVALLTSDQPSMRLYQLRTNGRFVLGSVQTVSTTGRQILMADLNGDREPEFLQLSSDGNTVSILGRQADAYIEKSYTLSSSAQKMHVADLNNDRRPDILLFGRGAGGISVLLAQPNGTFKQDATIYPDISISDVKTADINGDGITDIVALNWLSNQLIILHGIGRMVFSEQVAVPLPFEPQALTITPVSPSRTYRLAITFPEESKVGVYSGNALGDYRSITFIPTGSKVSDVALVDVNQDGHDDVVVGTSIGMQVALGRSQTSFTRAADFGISAGPGFWTLADLDADGKLDCVVADRSRNVLIGMANGDAAGRVDWPLEYAVGHTPLGLMFGDLNGSGRPDIGVVNHGSSTLSVLYNRGRGKFTGQQAVPLPEKPTAIRILPGFHRHERTLIASHANAEKVTVIAMGDQPSRAQTFSVPTGLEPYVLFTKVDTAQTRFVVRYKHARDKSLAISLFEQISQRQFLERSLRPNLPSRILGLTLEEGHRVGSYDLFFATNDRSTKLTTVSSSNSESGMEFKTTRQLFAYQDSLVSTRYVVAQSLNADGLANVIVVLGAPRNEIGIWLGRTRGAHTDSLEWIKNVQPASDDVVFLRDVNNDGLIDVVWLDTLRKSVLALFGNDRGIPRQPHVIAPAEGVSSIRIGAVRDAQTMDLIMSNTERGTISIVLDAFAK